MYLEINKPSMIPHDTVCIHVSCMYSYCPPYDDKIAKECGLYCAVVGLRRLHTLYAS